MKLPDPLELLDVDWCRRWVVVRGAAVATIVIILSLIAPQTLAKGVDWYAHHRYGGLVHDLQHLQDPLAPPSAGGAALNYGTSNCPCP